MTHNTDTNPPPDKTHTQKKTANQFHFLLSKQRNPKWNIRQNDTLAN